ncbi:hypothetical protein [Flavobacterium foetidum]|uniref:hypothetical protein n=1 Tax=Flavobacterium foetidum TaxID=2026681 RepID=UPI001074BDD3|nr:hypothetical protein [Flavobacterium foetidum]KAF2515700.1 hypothetical protein E0W73_08915 [Flavobacterium foetidum]
MKRIALILYFIFPTLSFSQEQINDPKVAFAIETYAFLKGQNAALEKVAVQFPQLKPNVVATEKNLKSAFGEAENNIQEFLQEELNNMQLDALHNHINLLLEQQFSNPIEKEKYAHDLLLTLKERSNYINNESVSKGILSFKYDDAPHEEITDGHVDFFTTKNHPKAEQVSLRIPVPKSWLAEEAEMPETIQQFTSFYGNGIEKILILVYDLPKELQDMKLTEKSISSLLPPETNVIRTEPLRIDDVPGFMIEVEESIKHRNENMKIRMLQFMFIQDQKLYCLQGSIGPAEPEEDLGFQIKKYEPLFRLIASRTEIE